MEKLIIQLVAGGKKWDIVVQVEESDQSIKEKLDGAIWEPIPGEQYMFVKDAPMHYHLKRIVNKES